MKNECGAPTQLIFPFLTEIRAISCVERLLLMIPLLRGRPVGAKLGKRLPAIFSSLCGFFLHHAGFPLVLVFVGRESGFGLLCLCFLCLPLSLAFWAMALPFGICLVFEAIDHVSRINACLFENGMTVPTEIALAVLTRKSGRINLVCATNGGSSWIHVLHDVYRTNVSKVSVDGNKIQPTLVIPTLQRASGYAPDGAEVEEAIHPWLQS